MRYDVRVRRQTEIRSRRFGVYGVTIADDGTETETLLEGGFFMQTAAANVAREYLGDVAERAERAAGWDPNP